MTAKIRNIRRVVKKGDIDVHQTARLVQPRWSILVADTEIEGEIRADLPGVVEVIILTGSAELDGCQGNCRFAATAFTQEVICKRITGSGNRSRILRRLPFKAE